MKTHTSSFKEQIKLIGKEIDSRITFGSTVLGKNDLNAVTPSYQGAILKSVMKQLDIDSNVEIPVGTILKYEFGLKVNGEYEYINYGNYVVYNIEKQEDTNSYKITCYDKLLYSMLNYVKLPITYPISIRDYINAISTALGLKFANKSGTFANYNKQIQADLYDGLGYTFRDVLDELAQVTASTICLNNNDELEIRYITETGDTIDEEFLKDVNVNFGEKFGAVNTIVLSRSGDSDSVYYPSVLPANPYEIKISDNQIMNGNDRADFLPDIYNKLNGLEFYTNDFVSTGICYYDLCDRYSVKVGDNTYSCIMFNDEVLVTQGLEENIYTELPEQTETDYKHASKDDRMINQVYIIAKKNEAEILAVVNTTNQIQKEINPTKDESGSEIIIEDASNNPLTYLEIEGKSTQETRSGKNLRPDLEVTGTGAVYRNDNSRYFLLKAGTYTVSYKVNELGTDYFPLFYIKDLSFNQITSNDVFSSNITFDSSKLGYRSSGNKLIETFTLTSDYYVQIAHYGSGTGSNMQVEKGSTATTYEQYGASPSPDYPSEIESVGYENLFKPTLIADDGSTILVGNGTAELNDDVFKFTAAGNDLYFGQVGFAGETYNVTKGNLIDVSNYDNIYYKLSNTLFTNNYITYYDENLVSFGFWQHLSNEDTINLSNAPAGTKYISFRFGYGSAVIGETYETKIQVYKGSVAHADIPYGKYGIEIKTTNNSNTNTSLIVLNEPLRSLTNRVKDIAYIRNNKLYVDRKIGSFVLKGSEDWVYYPEGSVFFADILGINMKTGIGLSNYYKNGSYGNENNVITPVGNRIHIRDDRFTTVEDFKTWLSTHNTQVDYELAEPYTEELGGIEMLKTLKGYNNIITSDQLQPIINLIYVTDTKIANYVEEHMAQIKINEDNIRLEVSKKIGSDEVVSSINQSAEQITLKSNRVVIESDNFTLDKDGTIKAKAGQIAGFNATEEGFYYLLQPKKNYTQEDIDKLSNHIYNGAILTEEEKELYDVNNDGVLNLQDIQMMSWTIKNNISNSMPGKFQISIPKEGKNPFVIDFGLYDGFGNLLNGFTYNKATFVNTEINGNLTVTGSKNRMVKVDDKNVLLNAYETTIPYFGDIGSSKTNENGYCKIEIEEIFSKTIESDDYKVFIQKCGQGDLYIIKHKKYFEVKGTPNLDFDWEIKAIQKGFKNIRLQEKER